MAGMRRFFNMKIAVVDLSEGSFEALPLNPDLIQEKTGGAAVNHELYSQYAEASPLVLGTGPLTGSLAPASCLLVATFQGPDDGRVSHTPLLFRAGPELKFSGYDFVIVKGACSRPGVLTIGEGTIRLSSAEGLQNLTVPEAEATLRRRNPESHRFVVLTGPAADRGSPYAAVGMGLGGSLDKTALAQWMAARNLKALVLNGNSGLPFEENHLALRKTMLDRLPMNKKQQGAREVLKRIAPSWNKEILPFRLITRHLACYGCPFPCASHITLRDSRHFGTQDRGFVLHDHVGFYLLSKRFGPDAPLVMNACIRLGLNPAAVTSFFPEKWGLEDLMQHFSQFTKEKDGDNLLMGSGKDREGTRILPDGISQEQHRLFGGGIPPILNFGGENKEAGWGKRVAAAMVMGICPLFLLLFPDLKTEELLRFLSPDDSISSLLQTSLENAIKSLLSQGR